MTKQAVVTFETVYEHELIKLQDRRLQICRVALAQQNDRQVPKPTSSSPDTPPAADVTHPDVAGNAESPVVKESLVGIALSGGGIRSATFCLGVLQSFYRRGVLRFADYLSAVSGGGYAAALISTDVMQQATVDWNCRAADDKVPSSRLSIEPGADGKQPPTIRRLARHAIQLRRPIQFLNRHLWGLVTINLFALTGLIAIGALAAYLMRLVDGRNAMVFLNQLGFYTDLSRAMFPAAMAFSCWVFISMLQSIFGRLGLGFPALSQPLYVVFMVTLILGGIVVLSTGDVDLTNFEKVFGVSPVVANYIRGGIHWVGTVLAVAFGASILPYFKISELLRSGTQPRNVVESWIFSVASHALVFGTPLVVFFYLSIENISGHNEHRPDPNQFVVQSIQDWPTLWRSIHRDEAGGGDKVAAALWNATKDDQPEEGKHPMERLIRIEDAKLSFDKQNSIVGRWLDFVMYCFGVTGDFSDGLKRQNILRETKETAIDAVNTNCLSDPQFFEKFADSPAKPDAVNQLPLANKLDDRNQDRQRKLLAQASGLKARAQRLLNTAAPNDDSQKNMGKLLVRRLIEARQNVAKQEMNVALITTDDDSSAANEIRSNAKSELDVVESLLNDIRSVNWELLMLKYGESAIRPRSTIFSSVVNEADQRSRLRIAFVSFFIFTVLGLMINLNTTSMHGFYKEQLVKLWCATDRDPRLSELTPTASGAPIPLWTGTLNLLNRDVDDNCEDTANFLFSPAYIGSSHTGYLASGAFMADQVTVGQAMAISGAALTPAGKHNLLFRVLLILTNFRLGQWVRNPHEKQSDWYWPSPLRCFWNILVHRADDREYCYVSDGGHSENTGIAPLLQRRCRVIIAIDGSHDSKSEFADLSKLIGNARWKYGIEFTSIHEIAGHENLESARCWKPVDLSDVTQQEKKPDGSLNKQRETASHYVLARFIYPKATNCDAMQGFLIYIKPTLTGDEPIELRKYAESHPEFPHDSTIDQFFEADRFEAYRHLGEHIGDSVVTELWSNGGQPAALWEWSPRSAASLRLSSSVCSETINEAIRMLQSDQVASQEYAAAWVHSRWTEIACTDQERILAEFKALQGRTGDEVWSDLLVPLINDLTAANSASPKAQKAAVGTTGKKSKVATE